MVIQSYLPTIGGAERQLASLCPPLSAAGIEPVVITRARPGVVSERPDVTGTHVIRVAARGPKAVRSVMFTVGALRALRRLRPDVVHAFDTLSPSTIAWIHKRTTGTPFVTKILRSGDLGDLQRLIEKPLGRIRRRRLLADADGFVAISADIDRELADLGVDEDRRVTCPNGVDTERFRPVPDTSSDVDVAAELGFDWEPGWRMVAVVGRIAPEKRIGDLAARWDGLRRSHPSARLVVIGDGPDRDAVADRDGVVAVGPRDDVENVVRHAAVYVSASDAEGLSNALLEAMSSGLACVVTDVGGVRDVIVDGESGIVVPPGDIDALLDGVRVCLDDPTMARRLGAAARDVVTARYGLDQVAARLAATYRRLAGNGDASAPT